MQYTISDQWSINAHENMIIDPEQIRIQKNNNKEVVPQTILSKSESI